MKKRSNAEGEAEPTTGSSATEGRDTRWRRLGHEVGVASESIGQRLAALYNALYNHVGLNMQTIREGEAMSGSEVRRPIRPSDTVDNDISTGAVFLVVLLLMLIVAGGLFFALTSTFPSFTGP